MWKRVCVYVYTGSNNTMGNVMYNSDGTQKGKYRYGKCSTVTVKNGTFRWRLTDCDNNV